MKAHNLPLPVSHTRAPVQIDRGAALLFAVALVSFGFLLGVLWLGSRFALQVRADNAVRAAEESLTRGAS